MNISIENISALERRLTVSVENSNVDQLIEVGLVDFSKTATLKGFRQGKLPMKVVKQKFGNSVKAQVLQDFVIDNFKTVLKKENFKIAGQPFIEKMDHLSDGTVEYIVCFEIYPEIKLADVSSVELEKVIVDITDQDVEKMIQELQERFCTWESVNRSSELDDRLTIDLIELNDQLSGKSKINKNIQIVLGGKNILPGLSEKLLNKQLDETVHTVLTFPEMWHDKAYAGQTVNIDVVIHKIEARQNLSQEALMEKLGIENRDEVKFKEVIFENMQVKLKNYLRAELQEQVLGILLEKNSLELPKNLIHSELQALKHEIANKTSQGMDFEMNLQDIAEKRVCLGLLVTEYIAQKNLKVTPERMIEKIKKMVDVHPELSPAEVVKAYSTDKNLLNNVERLVLLDQVVDTMVGEMKIKERKESFQDVMGQSI